MTPLQVVNRMIKQCSVFISEKKKRKLLIAKKKNMLVTGSIKVTEKIIKLGINSNKECYENKKKK